MMNEQDSYNNQDYQQEDQPLPEVESDDQELNKKIALYYHPLFQANMSQWFVLMQTKNYNRLSKEQYIDLNIKIQKSLILNFNEKSARESAEQDWKIDLKRETGDKDKLGVVEEDEPEEEIDSDAESDVVREIEQRKQRRLEEKEEKKSLAGIDYERLTEFFFDLCLSWGQHLDIETFLFFVNGIFLNITRGQHINVSVFRELEDIPTLSIEFFNHLLAYRATCVEAKNNNQSYSDWYEVNFQRTAAIVKNVEINLQDSFKDEPDENRILDIWIDLPPQIINQYLDRHFKQLDHDMAKIDVATKTISRLAQSIQIMEQLKKLEQMQTNLPQIQKQYTMTTSGKLALNTVAKYVPVNVFNDKTENQGVIEKRLVGQLGDRYKNAQLLELSRNNYLISNQVRLPLFGHQANLIERTKDTISRKGFIAMKDNQFYLSRAMNPSALMNTDLQRYVIDPKYRQPHQFILSSKQRSEQVDQVTARLQSNNPQNEDSRLNLANQGPTQSNELLRPGQLEEQYFQNGQLDSNSQFPQQKQSQNQVIDDEIVNKIYNSYIQLLQEDPNAKIRSVLQNEPFAGYLAQGFYQIADIEQAIYKKIYHEEESTGIQQMIAQFYNKFDELHEQSLTQALARSPNKQTIRNEVKYRVPEMWTKPFHKEDILSPEAQKAPGKPVGEEIGFVNKPKVVNHRKEYNLKREKSIVNQLQGNAAISNPILSHSMSHGNVAESAQKKEPRSPGESTDAQSALEEDSKLNNAFGAKHTFDWSEVAYLFESGEIPEEIASITDPVEYNYLMVRLRKEFNEKHKSNYLRYMNLNLPYHSRRDEVGGAITDQDWSNFCLRLEGIIEKIAKKRKRIIKRRKRKGKKKMPRKTLFTPQAAVNVSKDPLWREIFIEKDDAEDDSDSSNDDTELFNMYRQAMAERGIKVTKDDEQKKQSGIRSAKVELFNREKDPNTVLPPVKFPSMHPKEKPAASAIEEINMIKQQKKQLREQNNNRQKTAEMNLRHLITTNPNAAELLSMQLTDGKYPDPFLNKDLHKPNRTFNQNSPMTKKITHNYTQAIRVDQNQTQDKGAIFRNSAMTMINKERPFTDGSNQVVRPNFKPDSRGGISIDSGIHPVPIPRPNQGGFGTDAHLSSQVQNNPPSSLWRQHPIAKLLN